MPYDRPLLFNAPGYKKVFQSDVKERTTHWKTAKTLNHKMMERRVHARNAWKHFYISEYMWLIWQNASTFGDAKTKAGIKRIRTDEIKLHFSHHQWLKLHTERYQLLITVLESSIFMLVSTCRAKMRGFWKTLLHFLSVPSHLCCLFPFFCTVSKLCSIKFLLLEAEPAAVGFPSAQTLFSTM